MNLTTYNNNIQESTFNKVVAPMKLEREVVKSNISISLYEILISEETVSLVFKDVLSEEDKENLDELLQYHDGVEDVIEENKVRVLEESSEPDKQTGGAYMGYGLNHKVPPSVGVSSSYHTFPFPVALLDFEFCGMENTQGDTFSVKIAPNTVVGVITEAVDAGDTVFKVSPDVLNYVKLGYEIHLADSSTDNKVGFVTGIDKIKNELSVSVPANDNFLVSAPTYVKMSVVVVDKLTIQGLAKIELGSSKIGGSYLATGTPVELEYYNSNGVEKTFSGVLEYLY